MNIVLHRIQQESDRIYTYYFVPDEHVEYKAGQFALFTIPHQNMDDWGDSRWFTLSSAPTDEFISITVKFVTSNGSTFTEALRRATPGYKMQMDPPQGKFVLPDDPMVPLIFVAVGIGIAPYYSMFKMLRANHQDRNISLFYMVKNEKDLIFEDMLAALGDSAKITIKRPSDSMKQLEGVITSTMIHGHANRLSDSIVYLSGPPTIVKELHQQLIDLGISETQIVSSLDD